MSTRLPAKQVLNQRASKAIPVERIKALKASRDEKNYRIAVKHALQIQTQKDTEAQNLETIIKLVDYPTSPEGVFTVYEARTFVALVRSFQPSDYNSLIEERGIDGKCAYVLCGNKPRSCSSRAGAAVWKKGNSATAGAAWCSAVCAEKAMYVRAQLSETPAWERVPGQQAEVFLHPDDRPRVDEDVGGTDGAKERRERRTERVDAWRQQILDAEELARERGEGVSSLRPSQVIADQVVERSPQALPLQKIGMIIGRVPDAAESHHSIEGYQPKRPKPKIRSVQTRKEQASNDDDDDDDDDGDDDE